jgi:hypothetical protein
MLYNVQHNNNNIVFFSSVHDFTMYDRELLCNT